MMRLIWVRRLRQVLLRGRHAAAASGVFEAVVFSVRQFPAASDPADVEYQSLNISSSF